MRISFAPAFLKALDKLDPQVKVSAKEAAAKVIDFYERRSKAPGLGVNRLRLYLHTDDELRFVLAGTHDDVKKYLSRV